MTIYCKIIIIVPPAICALVSMQLKLLCYATFASKDLAKTINYPVSSPVALSSKLLPG